MQKGTQNGDGLASHLTQELGWPLNINKEMDDHAIRHGLAHWNCTSKTSNVYWIRRDGLVHAVTFKENGGYPAELRKIDTENSIDEFVF